jgi:hypothetical protein
LDAAVHGIGFSDLCSPLSLRRILIDDQSEDENLKDTLHDNNKREQSPIQVSKIHLRTSSNFRFSALIYYPYRALYAWSSVISGETCSTPDSWCWHQSLEHGARKNFTSLDSKHFQPGTCPSDHAQNELIQVWDNLRTENEHVAIFGDISMLSEAFLNQVDTIISIIYPCVMSNHNWNIYEGLNIRQIYLEKSNVYDFRHYLINMPNEC